MLARDIRAAVAGCRVPTEHGEAWTTVSLGIAELQADDALGEEAMQRADAAMYRAKRRGGDRLAIAGDELVYG